MMMTTKPSPPNDLDFARDVFLLFSILALASVVHLLDLEDTDREEDAFCIVLVVVVVVNVSLLFDEAEVNPEEEDNDTGANISFFYGETPPEKKGSASTRANNMHASVAALMGRRAVRESFTALTTKLSKKSGYYKGKRSVSPGWHEKKVGGGGQREIRFARLEETDVRDSGRIECVYVESVRRERRDEVIERREVNDFVVVVFKFFDVVDGVVVQEVCLRGIVVDWKTQRDGQRTTVSSSPKRER